MTLEQQVCSLELAKKLKELGVKQESLFYWVTTKPTDIKPTTIEWEGDIEWIRENISHTYITEQVSAFTVAELGEILSRNNDLRYYFNHVWQQDKQSWIVMDVCLDNYYEYASTEADARAKMLIYLIKNKLITL